MLTDLKIPVKTELRLSAIHRRKIHCELALRLEVVAAHAVSSLMRLMHISKTFHGGKYRRVKIYHNKAIYRSLNRKSAK